MTTPVLHLCLAILLFYAVNWLGEHSRDYKYLQLSVFVRPDQAPAFNFILKVFAPSVYVLLVATLFYSLDIPQLVSGIWLVTVYYFGFRILYNLILGRALLLNWASLGCQALVGVGVAYFVYLRLILPRTPLFPSADNLSTQVWVIVALFLYAAFNSIRTGIEASTRRKNSFLRSRFGSLRIAYGSVVEGQFPQRYMELVAYAIMIYETFNRPWIVRVVERAVFPWGSHTLGPMQISTSQRLSETDSVREGVRILHKHFQATSGECSGKLSSKFEIISLTLAKYNRDETYVREILHLLHILWAQVAPEYRTEFELAYQPEGIERASGQASR